MKIFFFLTPLHGSLNEFIIITRTFFFFNKRIVPVQFDTRTILMPELFHVKKNCMICGWDRKMMWFVSDFTDVTRKITPEKHSIHKKELWIKYFSLCLALYLLRNLSSYNSLFYGYNKTSKLK